MWSLTSKQININFEIVLSLIITLSFTVTIMLRKWLLKPYIEALENQVKDLSNLKREVEDLRERLTRLEEVNQKLGILEEKVKILDHVNEDVKDARLWIRELLKDIENLKLEIEAIKLKSITDSSTKEKLDELELEARVYELIQKGYHSPTKLAQILGISKDKLYRILRRLQEARLITTKGKGRKKKYVPKIEAETEESS